MKELLSEDTIKQIHRAMWRTWETLGADIMTIEGVGDSISREEVVELILDAGYLESYGNCDKSILKEFRKLSYEDQEEIAKQRFPYERYS